MIRVQNLTNRKLRFQGVTIEPYGSYDYPNIYDYITLSRFVNTGAARYNTVKIQPKVEEPVVEEVKETAKAVEVEPVVEPVTEPVVEPVVEEVKTEEPVKEDEQEPKPSTKRTYNKKSKKDEE